MPPIPKTPSKPVVTMLREGERCRLLASTEFRISTTDIKAKAIYPVGGLITKLPAETEVVIEQVTHNANVTPGGELNPSDVTMYWYKVKCDYPVPCYVTPADNGPYALIPHAFIRPIDHRSQADLFEHQEMVRLKVDFKYKHQGQEVLVPADAVVVIFGGLLTLNKHSPTNNTKNAGYKFVVAQKRDVSVLVRNRNDLGSNQVKGLC